MNTDKRKASHFVELFESQIRGKCVITTGVSPGSIGAAFVQALAKANPSMLVLAGRSPSKLEQTAQAIKQEHPDVQVRKLELDLVSLTGVRDAAATLNGWDDVPQVDVLVNSAAVMAPDWAATLEGYDSQLVINHLGPFLFTNLIMGKLTKSPAPRVINVSSDGHRLGPVRFDDYNFQDGSSYNKWLSYGQAKSANMLMAISLAEKLGKSANLTAFSANPGLVMSNLGNHLKLFGESDTDMQSMREIDQLMGNAIGFATWEGIMPDDAHTGAGTYVHAAFDPELAAHNGAYLTSCRVADPWVDTVRPWATSSVEAERLWKLSEKLVNQEFQY